MWSQQKNMSSLTGISNGYANLILQTVLTRWCMMRMFRMQAFVGLESEPCSLFSFWNPSNILLLFLGDFFFFFRGWEVKYMKEKVLIQFSGFSKACWNSIINSSMNWCTWLLWFGVHSYGSDSVKPWGCSLLLLLLSS